MGQLALGVRSLIIRLGIFCVMAALLAWVLGGTLLPRPEVVDRGPVQVGGESYFVRLVVGGRDEEPPRWTLWRGNGEDATAAVVASFEEVAGPVVGSSGTGLFAGRLGRSGAAQSAGLSAGFSDGEWRIYVITPGQGAVERESLPDRLAVEMQFARFASGASLLSGEEIAGQKRLLVESSAPPAEND